MDPISIAITVAAAAAIAPIISILKKSLEHKEDRKITIEVGDTKIEVSEFDDESMERLAKAFKELEPAAETEGDTNE